MSLKVFEMLTIISGIVLLGIMLGVLAVIFKLLLKGNQLHVKDYRTQNEIDMPNSYRVGRVLVGLCIHPVQTIKSGIIGLYDGKWCWVWITMAAVLCSVVIKLRIQKINVIYIPLIAIGAIAVFKVSILIKTFIYSNLGNLKLYEKEGKRILGILFLWQMNISVISYAIRWGISSFVMPMQKVGQSFGVLDIVIGLWAFYIEYLLLKERYGMTKKESILNVGLADLSILGIGLIMLWSYAIVMGMIILKLLPHII